MACFKRQHKPFHLYWWKYSKNISSVKPATKPARQRKRIPVVAPKMVYSFFFLNMEQQDYENIFFFSEENTRIGKNSICICVLWVEKSSVYVSGRYYILKSKLGMHFFLISENSVSELHCCYQEIPSKEIHLLCNWNLENLLHDVKGFIDLFFMGSSPGNISRPGSLKVCKKCSILLNNFTVFIFPKFNGMPILKSEIDQL